MLLLVAFDETQLVYVWHSKCLRVSVEMLVYLENWVEMSWVKGRLFVTCDSFSKYRDESHPDPNPGH